MADNSGPLLQLAERAHELHARHKAIQHVIRTSQNEDWYTPEIDRLADRAEAITLVELLQKLNRECAEQLQIGEDRLERCP